jgi:hypothetical protein
MTRARYLEMAREAVRLAENGCPNPPCDTHSVIAALLEAECGKAWDALEAVWEAFDLDSNECDHTECFARTSAALKKARP